MRHATKVTVIKEEDSVKTFTREEFLRVMRSGHFVGSYSFWRSLERLAQPEERTRTHAHGVLHAMAESHFVDCKAVAFSEQHAEASRYCGFQPVRIATPGELTRTPTL